MEDKKQFLDTLNIGISYQLILLMVKQAFVLEKLETITSLGEVFQKFYSMLSDDEKRAFKEEIDMMLDSQGAALGEALFKETPPEDIDATKKELETLVSADIPQQAE